MRLEAPGSPHLGYCTNIHAGETWEEIAGALKTHLPAVKQRVSPAARMGVGLRLSGIAADALAEPEALAGLKDFLRAHDLYVFTVNAFPYGPFHGVTVKETVYAPDWRHPERLRFTNRVADILAELLPRGTDGSISSVPGAFKADIAGPRDVECIAHALIEHAAHLHALREATGTTITLALEPEPCCLLETTADAVAFFKQHLFSRAAVATFSDLTGASETQAEAGLQRHLAVCFDVCHAAVEFEVIGDSIRLLDDAGIRIAKVQLSSALRLEQAHADAERLLRPFDEGIYLHQTVIANDGNLVRYRDLPEAFASLRRGNGRGEWRVHCHVPVFLAAFGQLQSTQSTLAEVLALCRQRHIAPHLEVETYTWNVLPPGLRQGGIDDDISRELAWVCSQLAA